MMKLATVLVLLVGLAVSGGDNAATSNIRGDLTFPVERELSHRKLSSSSSSKSGSRSGSRSGGHRRCGYVILNPKGSDSRSCYRKLKKEIEEKLRVHVTDGSSSSCESSRSRHSHRGGWRNLRSGRKLNSPSSSSSSSHKHHHSHSGSRSKSWTCYGRKVDEITIRSSDCKTSDDKKEIIDDIEDELYETYRDSRADYCARKGSSSSSSSESSSSTKSSSSSSESSSSTKSSSSSSESSSSSSDKKASSSSGSKASKSTERK